MTKCEQIMVASQSFCSRRGYPIWAQERDYLQRIRYERKAGEKENFRIVSGKGKAVKVSYADTMLHAKAKARRLFLKYGTAVIKDEITQISLFEYFDWN